MKKYCGRRVTVFTLPYIFFHRNLFLYDFNFLDKQKRKIFEEVFKVKVIGRFRNGLKNFQENTCSIN